MISSRSRISICAFAAGPGNCSVLRYGIRMGNCGQDRDSQSASFRTSSEEKHHFFGSPGM
jgi:hypothetical protein